VPPDEASVRAHRSDAHLPAVLGLVATAELVALGPPTLWLGLLSIWLATGVLCLRRAAPVAMPLAVALIYALTAAAGFDVSVSAAWLLLLAFACLSTGRLTESSRLVAGLASVLASVAVICAGLAWFTAFEPSVLFGLVFSLGAWSLGVALRRALDRAADQGTELEQVRVERALAAKRAAASERKRIAAELHDALAHALGAMVLQAAAAADLVRRDADAGAAATAARGVAQAGRDALGETGRLLRLLRDERDELGLHVPALDARPPAPQAAAPRLAFAAAIRPTDLLLPALIGIVGTVEIATGGFAPAWAALGTLWLAAAALCARRVAPVAVPVAVAGLALVDGLRGGGTEHPTAWIAALALACFAAGLHVPRRRAWPGLASVFAAVALGAIDMARSGDLRTDFVFLLAVAAPWAAGYALAETLERTRDLAAEAEHARLEHELEEERGRVAERRRIARELHDVLANSFSVMIVQAALAAELAGADRAAATSAVGAVQDAGRGALGRSAGCSAWSIRAAAPPASIRSTPWRTCPRSPTSTVAPASRSSCRSTERRGGSRSGSSSRRTGSCRRR